MSLKQLKKDIAASLYVKPASLLGLLERDGFLKHMSRYGIEMALDTLERKGHIYMKGDVYHCYTKYAKSDEMLEYGF